MNSMHSTWQTPYSPNIKLADIINVNLRAISVFEKYKVDYCRKGNRSIKDVCKEHNLDVKELITELETIRDDYQADKFGDWNLDFLVDYIINNHHRYIYKMIPIIIDQISEIKEQNGFNNSVFPEITKCFSVIYKDLKQHMLKEEQILFPYIKQLVSLKEAGSKSEKPYFGKIDNPINMMESEHKAALEEYERMTELTNDFSKDEKSGLPFSRLLMNLKSFGRDLQLHIHLENNLLFPKAIALEREMI